MRVRGYQRKVIYLKNTGSRMFDEAYFVVREDSEVTPASEGDMITEANRIIEENFGSHRERGRPSVRGRDVLSFLCGVAATGILTALLLVMLL